MNYVRPSLIPKKPIISTKEARKLIGKGASSLSDLEIKSMIKDYELLARQAIREYLVRK